LEQFVPSDASTGDKYKKCEKPHVDRSNVAQHPGVAGGKADKAVIINKFIKHNAVNAAQFSPSHLRHQHVVKQPFPFGLLSLVHKRLEEPV